MRAASAGDQVGRCAGRRRAPARPGRSRRRPGRGSRTADTWWNAPDHHRARAGRRLPARPRCPRPPCSAWTPRASNPSGFTQSMTILPASGSASEASSSGGPPTARPRSTTSAARAVSSFAIPWIPGPPPSPACRAAALRAARADDDRLPAAASRLASPRPWSPGAAEDRHHQARDIGAGSRRHALLSHAPILPERPRPAGAARTVPGLAYRVDTQRR